MSLVSSAQSSHDGHVVLFGNHAPNPVKQVDDGYLLRRRRALIDELKVCSMTKNLKRGKEIHGDAMESGDDSCNYVAATLINMYAKCGCMVEARQVFNSMQHLDVVSCNALIMGYAKNGEGVNALDVFESMKSQGCTPTSITFIAALKACTCLANETNKAECLERGKEIHSLMGCHLDMNVKNTLIDMYAKCGSMLDARKVFDSMKQPNVVSWNNLLFGYAEHGEGATTLELFEKMRSQGFSPDSITFVAVLKACTSLAEQNGSRRREILDLGKEIHSQIGPHLDAFVESSLIYMYAKCGSMVNARQVFDTVRKPNTVSWNAIILGYADNGQGSTALNLFESMMASKSCAPDSITFVAALKACASLALDESESRRTEIKERGKRIHSLVGRHLNIHVQNTLLDMYTKCGSMVDARQVFESMNHSDVVSWTTLILGYAKNGQGATALDMFARMISQGCAPNSVTFIAALKACTCLALDDNESGKAECLERGKEIHSQVGCHMDTYVQSTLIDMYSKCGCMNDARKVFENMKHPDVVSWNALLLGYAWNGEGIIALDAFSRMKSQGCPPNCITFAAALKACGLFGAYESGSRIHAEIDAGTTECDLILVGSLVDFYGKCGSVVEAQKVFDSHPTTRDLVTWNSLMAGYSRLGDNQTVFDLFIRMQDAGFEPDCVTFLSLLTCCNHAGLVEKADEVFRAMVTKHGVTPSVEHYTCMVDILGRSNKLDDSMAVLHSMRVWPNAVSWMTVLGACRKWKNVGIGRLAFKSVVSLDDEVSGAYVLMAHIYGSRGMWEEQQMVLQRLDMFAELGR